MKVLFFIAFCLPLFVASCTKSPNEKTLEVLYLSTDKTQISLSSSTNSIDTFKVQSNTSWYISIPTSSASWLQLSATNGTNDAGIAIKTVSENTTSTDRVATLRIIPNDSSLVTPVTVTIIQKAFAANIAWYKTFGTSRFDEFHSAVRSPDGGILATGFIRDVDGTIKMSIVKTDAGGNRIWEKIYAGNVGGFGNCIITTSDGGYIVSGVTEGSNGDINGDVWIVKLDAAGNKSWSKTFGGSAFEEGNGIVQTPDGGYVFCATTKSSDRDVKLSKGKKDVWVVKLNNTGDIVWQKTFGGSNDDIATGLLVDLDGNFLVSATTFSTDGDVLGFLGGDSDGWILKLDANGNLLWSKTIGGTNADEANAITLMPNGDYAAAGYTTSYVTGWKYNGDFMMMKLNKNGTLVQERAAGSFELDKAYGITSTSDGGVVLTGFVSTTGGDVYIPQHGGLDIWVVKFDASANKVWDKTFGGSGHDKALCVFESSNGLVVAGYMANNVSTGSTSYLDQKALLFRIGFQ